MTPQVKDFDEFLAMAVPAASPSTSTSTSTTSASTTTTTTSASTSSFFEDISQLQDDSFNNDNNNNNTSTTFISSTDITLSPVQLVTLSNLKLNNDMYSNRSLSIHRRILVKNFLTVLYQQSPPMEWMMPQYYGDGESSFELDSPPPEPDEANMLLRQDEQNGWMEQTLVAAGLNDDDDLYNTSSLKKQSTNPFSNPKNNSTSTTPSSPSTTTTSSSSGPPTLSLSLSFDTPSSSSTTSSTGTSSRPKSTELPQTLNSYLSSVFNVDWSVELPSKEDILFTHAPSSTSSTASSSDSTSSSSSPPPISSVASKRKSITSASGLSSTYLSFSNGNVPAISTSPRSSTASTSSSISSVSSTSTVSSISSVGSIGNGSTTAGAGAEIGLNKPVESNNNLNGSTKTAPATSLVRKSSLSSSSSPILSSNTQNTNSNTNSNNNNNNNSPVATNSVGNITNSGLVADGKSLPSLPVKKTGINGHPKPMLVPGRRSSLRQTGQIPSALPLTKNNNNTPTSTGTNGVAKTNPVAVPTSTETGSSLTPTKSASPSLSPTFSPATLSAPNSASSPSLSPPLSFVNTATSPNMRPTFSRRTSSLPAERPQPVQRSPSSENTLAVTTSVPQANIIGLPRPLLSPTFSSAELPGSPPSPPASTTTSPIQTTEIGSAIHTQLAKATAVTARYVRSASDDHLLARPGVLYTPSGSPNLSAHSPPSSPPLTQSANLSRPSPSYLKGSKSSPNLVGLDSDSQDSAIFQPMPDLYLQQQQQHRHQQQQQQLQQPYYQQNPISYGSEGAGAGFAKTSPRRGMASPSGGAEMLAPPSHGTMNISAPLPLVPNNQSYNDYGTYNSSYNNNNNHHNNNNNSPYQHGHGHAYAQSMSNVSMMSDTSVMTSKTNRSHASEKPTAGRWSSMKAMFGLRGGQGTK
ncbi:hypothetical protein BGZ46_007418 [Entomortierella lignicola]|nr:hypothetical protein BGZ46_007418 [Entomortierella lignicola]